MEAYAKEQEAEWTIKVDNKTPIVTVTMSTTKENGDSKIVRVDYGPEDFLQEDLTADSIVKFLAQTWKNA